MKHSLSPARYKLIVTRLRHASHVFYPPKYRLLDWRHHVAPAAMTPVALADAAKHSKSAITARQQVSQNTHTPIFASFDERGSACVCVTSRGAARLETSLTVERTRCRRPSMQHHSQHPHHASATASPPASRGDRSLAATAAADADDVVPWWHRALLPCDARAYLSSSRHNSLAADETPVECVPSVRFRLGGGDVVTRLRFSIHPLARASLDGASEDDLPPPLCSLRAATFWRTAWNTR